LLEDRYVGLVGRLAHHPGLAVGVFFAIVGVAAAIFARHPTGFLPTEDQGYCIVVARLPPGASQPRLRGLAAGIRTALHEAARDKGWVTSGGFSALDAAILSNVVTVYVMYEDWDRRPAGLSQSAIVNGLRERLQSIRSADFSVLVPPPIPGLGEAGGFQMMV